MIELEKVSRGKTFSCANFFLVTRGAPGNSESSIQTMGKTRISKTNLQGVLQK